MQSVPAEPQTGNPSNADRYLEARRLGRLVGWRTLRLNEENFAAVEIDHESENRFPEYGFTTLEAVMEFLKKQSADG
jgi:hypothetical protein